MRATLLATMLLLASPLAGAAGSSVDLRGPDRIDGDGIESVTLLVALVLEGVVCTGEADVPVRLRIDEVRGVGSASLGWDEVLFRLAGHESATRTWHGEAQVDLRVRDSGPDGLVRVRASYALPSHCFVLGGASAGEATHDLRIRGAPVEPAEDPLGAPAPPPAVASRGERDRAAAFAPVPFPVLGAIVGMIAGGVAVAAKRWREHRP